jgi:hypothetical protein
MKRESSCVVESMVEEEGCRINVHITLQVTVEITRREAEVKE